MPQVTYVFRLLVPAVVALALLAPALAGCGISKDELTEELRPLRESQRDHEQQLIALQTRTERNEQNIAELLERLRNELRQELASMDEKYEEYQETALAFKALYDEIDAVRRHNVEIYQGVYSMLDSMIDLYNEQANLMRNYSSRTNYVVQRIEGMLEELSEYAPQPPAGAGD